MILTRYHWLGISMVSIARSRILSLIKSEISIRTGEHTFFAPLYSDFWYFSASVIQEVWLFHCEGPENVALQSMHVKEA